MRSVAQAMNREDLIEDPRFAQRLQRYKNMDAFVAEIESWSETLTAEQCEAAMNNAGTMQYLYCNRGSVRPSANHRAPRI